MTSIAAVVLWSILFKINFTTMILSNLSISHILTIFFSSCGNKSHEIIVCNYFSNEFYAILNCFYLLWPWRVMVIFMNYLMLHVFLEKSHFGFNQNYLTPFMPMLAFYTSWEHQKSRGFKMFSGDKRETSNLEWAECVKSIKGSKKLKVMK